MNSTNTDGINTRNTVESVLVRRLEIRFIDARQIVTEAKLNLQIYGYPNKEQAALIEAEAISIFNQRSKREQKIMWESSASLNSAKEFLFEESFCIEEDHDNGDDGSLGHLNNRSFSSLGSSFSLFPSLSPTSNCSTTTGHSSSSSSLMSLSRFSPVTAFMKSRRLKMSKQENKLIRDELPGLLTDDF